MRVLECDGPPRKYVQRGEGSYYLETSNFPVCDPISTNDGFAPDFRLTDWGQPNWEIYQNHDGSIHVHACRPTDEEIRDGDLHGALGSVIQLAVVSRAAMGNAMWLARKLCKCDPAEGIIAHPLISMGLARIESDIPITWLSWNDPVHANFNR